MVFQPSEQPKRSPRRMLRFRCLHQQDHTIRSPLFHLHKKLTSVIQMVIPILILCFPLGCSHTPQYTSKDLTILPCEQKAHEFFFPLEFDEHGSFVYGDQPSEITKAMPEAESIYVFVHGWNKIPKLAETDYQDLICRFYTHSKANRKKSIIIGVFWPSAEFLPIFNFWTMKKRADTLATTGFQNLMKLLDDGAKADEERRHDLIFIGHSFGGRIILNGISQYTSEITPDLHSFLSRLNQFQIILITAAMGEYILWESKIGVGKNFDALRAEWNSDVFYQRLKTQARRSFSPDEILVDPAELRVAWHPSLVQLSGVVDLRIYNIFSSNDQANKLLYRVGSLFEDDGPTCGIGACGVRQWPNTVSAASSGSLKTTVDLSDSNLWNVDATDIISSHTDIYKGRVANLLWELISMPTPKNPEVKEVPLLVGPGSGFGYRKVYEWMGEENLRAMQVVNNFRKMGLAGRTFVNQYGALAHRLDEALSTGDWSRAERNIEELERIDKGYPGWFLHIGLGLVHEGKFLKSSQVAYEWYPLGSFSLKLLRGFALARQGRCADAEAAFIDSTRLMFSEVRYIKNAWWQFPIVEKLGDHNLVFHNCYFRKTGKENDTHSPMPSQSSETPAISHP